MKTAVRALAVAVVAGGLAACAHLTPADRTDPGIRARLESAFNEHRRELDLRYVTLDVHMGVVTLTGLVRSRVEQDELRRLVYDVGGFEQLIYNVSVQE